MVSCLLIDKNPLERQKLQQMLGTMGFHCDERSGAEEGIRFCQESNPDVVVMEASGVKAAKEFLRLVRYQGRAQRRPVVILYAEKPNMASVGETIIEGAADFLVKPFDRDLLLFKLEQAGVRPN
jgi:two-component system, chemotaxis family, chemotaxis protein CheY